MSKSKKGKRRQTKKADSNFLKKWWDGQQKRKHILKFGLALIVIMAIYFSFSYSVFFEHYINFPIISSYAHVGNILFNLFGLETIVEETYIKNSLFTMNIGKGCDAVSPTILFMAAILIYPTDFSNKWKWLLISPFAFALLNLIRIISLFLIGSYVPSIFDFAHTEFWQGVFILITILAWFYWLISILNKGKGKH